MSADANALQTQLEAIIKKAEDAKEKAGVAHCHI
jgi:hypothetical protein